MKKAPSLLQEAKARRQHFLRTVTVGKVWAQPLLAEIAYTELDKLEAIARLHDSLSQKHYA